MLTIVKRTAGLWWQSWPSLVAVYLVGWFVRYWTLQGAIAVGLEHGRLWGHLVVAVVPMVRLATYLGMFLVLRSATTELQHVDQDGTAPRGVFDIALSAVLPFLVIYTAWKLVLEDYYVYVTTVDFTTVYQGAPARTAATLANDFGTFIWVVIGAAFLLRQLLTRNRERLPRWTTAVALYCEVLWIFLVFLAGAGALFGTPQWISERRVVVWFAEVRDQLFSHFALLGQWWHAVTDVLGVMIPVLGLSLAWLAIAGVMYGTPLAPSWQGARQVFLGHRGGIAAERAMAHGYRVVDPRWQRLPTAARERTVEFLRGQLGRFASIVDAARLILHGGFLPIAFFVAAYTALILLSPNGAYFDRRVSDGLLWRWVALLIGPHDWAWWQSFYPTIRVGIGALIDPLRICLVTATYWYCIDRVRHENAANTANAAPQPVSNLSTTGERTGLPYNG